MADIFLSAAWKDRVWAEQVERQLIAEGWEVWWAGDRFAPRLKFDAEAELEVAKCVVVLWSKQSILSQRVCAEAVSSRKRGVLVQATIDGIDPPPPFPSVPCANLSELSSNPDQTNLPALAGFRELASAIRSFIPPEAAASSPSRSGTEDTRHAQESTGHRPHLRTIFLCYRRQDTQGHTGRLRDRLATAYGKDAVFMDVEDVPHGIDFVEYIEEVLASCAVMVVLIGKEWTSIADRKGRRRLDQSDDLVRGEIAAAFKRNIPVIPVLVEDAAMPYAEDVPKEIRGLTRLNAIELTHRRWEADVQQVLNVVEKFMGRERRARNPTVP